MARNQKFISNKEENIVKKPAGFWILVLVFMSLVITFGSKAFAEGLTKITDNVYAYVDIKGSSPANSFGANAGIVIGKDGIVVIDTLVSAKEAKRFINDIRKISDKPIKYVVNTHYHLDHAFGNSEFEKLGATIISHVNDDQNLRKNGEAALKDAKEFGLTESDMEGTVLAYPGLTFSNKMVIDIGNQKAELIYTGNSHTNGSIVVYLPDKKVLFAGDILFTNYHPFIAEGDLKSWYRVLDYILKMDVNTIIPGHGPISNKKDVTDMKTYLAIFDKSARKLSAKSKDAEYVFSEIKKILPKRAEADWLIKANLQMKYLK